jgi:hypothetical protein
MALQFDMKKVTTFDRGGAGRRIADGRHECNFAWELRQAA